MVTVGAINKEFNLGITLSKADSKKKIEHPPVLELIKILKNLPTTQRSAVISAKRIRATLDLKPLRKVEVAYRSFLVVPRKTNVYDLLSQANPAIAGKFDYDIPTIFTKKFVKKNCSAMLKVTPLLPTEYRAKFEKIIINYKRIALSAFKEEKVSLSESVINLKIGADPASYVLISPQTLKKLNDPRFVSKWIANYLISVGLIIMFIALTGGAEGIPCLGMLIIALVNLILSYVYSSLEYKEMLKKDKQSPISGGKKPSRAEVLCFYRLEKQLPKESELMSDGRSCYYPYRDFAYAPGEVDQLVERGEILSVQQVLILARELLEDTRWFEQFKKIIQVSGRISEDGKDEIISVFELIKKIGKEGDAPEPKKKKGKKGNEQNTVIFKK